MGPNPAKLLEQTITRYPLDTGSTVLDLGCGRGVTSIMLAKAYGLKVFATDLWITPTENKKRFDEAVANARTDRSNRRGSTCIAVCGGILRRGGVYRCLSVFWL